MTDLQLIYFTTIVETGSFSDAALELNISQSSISKQIMQLEDELGVKLFDRSTRRIHLSSAGEYLFEDAVAALAKIRHLKESARIVSDTVKKHLSLLALPVIGHYNFYIPIQLFESEHPGYQIDIEELEEPDIYKRMSAGDFDAAITYFNPNQMSRFSRFVPLIEDEMIFVCNKEHEFSSEKFITPEMIDDMPVLSMQKYTCVSQLYQMYFRKHGSNPHIVFRGRPGTIMVGAQAGRAPALLTRIHTDTLKISNVSMIPFFPPLKGILGIIINEQAKNVQILDSLATSLSAAK